MEQNPITNLLDHPPIHGGTNLNALPPQTNNLWHVNLSQVAMVGGKGEEEVANFSGTSFIILPLNCRHLAGHNDAK